MTQESFVINVALPIIYIGSIVVPVVGLIAIGYLIGRKR